VLTGGEEPGSRQCLKKERVLDPRPSRGDVIAKVIYDVAKKAGALPEKPTTTTGRRGGSLLLKGGDGTRHRLTKEERNIRNLMGKKTNKQICIANITRARP